MQITDDPLFTPLLLHEAPLASRTLLEQAQRYFGFVPNLLASLAHSPSALKVYLNADLGFQHGTLTPGEQQIVLLTASKVRLATLPGPFRHFVLAHPWVVNVLGDIAPVVVAAVGMWESLLSDFQGLWEGWENSFIVFPCFPSDRHVHRLFRLQLPLRRCRAL